MVVTLALIPLIIGRIGMANYGVIMLTLIFNSAASFIDVGFSKSVTLLLGKTSESLRESQIVSAALIINLLLAVIISSIIFVLVANDVKVFGKEFDKVEYTGVILISGLLILWISLLKNLSIAILEAKYMVHYINIGNTFSSVFLYLSLYLFTFLTIELKTLLFIPVVPLLITLFYFILIICKKTSLSFTRVNFVIFREISKVSVKFLNIGIVNAIISPANKYALVLLTGNPAYLGILDVGMKIAKAANNVLGSLSVPLFGVFSNLQDSNEIYRVVKKTTTILFIAFIAGVVAFYFTRNLFANIFDAENAELIAQTSFWLLFGICSIGVSEPAYRALLGMARLKEALLLKIIVPITNVIVFIVLYSQPGLFRITYALSFSMIIGAISILFYYSKNWK